MSERKVYPENSYEQFGLSLIQKRMENARIDLAGVKLLEIYETPEPIDPLLPDGEQKINYRVKFTIEGELGSLVDKKDSPVGSINP